MELDADSTLLLSGIYAGVGAGDDLMLVRELLAIAVLILRRVAGGVAAWVSKFIVICSNRASMRDSVRSLLAWHDH
jgi:hypothetical protein